MGIIEIIIEAFFLTIALSIDAFASGLAYGTNKIKLPKFSIIIISSICSFILAISLFFGTVIGQFVSTNITLIICVVIMFFLGIIKLFDGYIKSIIKKNNGLNKNIAFSIFNLKLTLNLYAKPEDADFDHSKVLSAKEAVAIAIALSLDSLTIGFGQGLLKMTWLYSGIIIFFSFIIGILALAIGGYLGNRISKKSKINLSWLGGLILIIMAILKIVM